MDRTLRRLLTLGLLLGAPLALAQSSPVTQACWNRDVERIDYFENPPEGGDNAFFTGVSNTSGNTNVTLIWPAHATLMDFTQRLYRIRVDLGGTTPTGCSNAYLNGLGYFLPTGVNPPAGPASLQGTYDPTKTYPDPGPTYAGGNGQSDNLKTGNAYRYRNWPSSGSASGTAESYSTACLNAGTAAQQAACLACLNTHGYWLNPTVADKDISTSAAVFTTNWLRFHPVKWVLLSLAYKRLVNGPLLSSLREAVVGQSANVGATLLQKMLPQSCAGQGRPLQQKITAIDNVTYTNGAYPLAEMLFNAGWFMGGQSNPWLFSSSTTIPTGYGNTKSGPCVNCRGDFIVLFGDGRGDTANAACTPVSGVTPPWCSAAAQCSTLGMGVEDDGNDFLNPSTAGGTGSAISGSGVRQAPAGTCDMDFADDVASWMNVTPMGIGYPNSTIRTYVVAIGDPKNTYGEMTTLQQVAARGGGDYVVADDYATLESNINNVFTAIVSRSTSFSAASITTVQSSGYTSAFLPRFTPNGGQLWPGTVTRFNLFNEFAAGCTSADQGKVDSLNPNGNGSCNDFYLTDAKSSFIGEQNGQFVVLDNSQKWDAGWPALAGGDGGVPASPYWEAGQVLTARVNAYLAGNSSKQRNIYTVAPSSSGGYAPSLIQFTAANASTLTPLFQLGGVNGDFCTTLGNLTRHTYVTETDCGQDLIDFVNGKDILFQNPYNRTNPAPSSYQARPNLLGDVFHSTPVLVTPPAPTYLCDLGVANQCVPSLYDSRFEPGGQDAYTSYFTANQYRTQFLLVGANDGMLHAFNAGNDTVSNGAHAFDMGTGDEMWAFIPPDLLPKLIRLALGDRHELMVDGTPMVRDIWVDLNGDHQKQSNEYRTVAITGEREGGRSFFALDVTNPTAPSFLWLSPPPGTNDALVAGESWNDLGPAAPPIGPVAEADSHGVFKVQGVPARERYVVAVGGGFDPAYLRGRAIWVLDAWTGQSVYRFSASDSTGSGDLRSALFPVAAPPSLADTDADGLFDTLVVGDTGGQVWTVGMGEPGSPNGSGGNYNNWYAARAFIEFKGQPFWHRSPIFQRAVLGLLPGNVWRLFVGTGDRDQIKDPNGGTCGLANLGACLRKNCSVQVTATRYRIAPGSSGAHYESGNWSFSAGGTQPSPSLQFDSPPDKQSGACSDVVDSQIDTSISCGSTNAQYSAQAYCDWSPGTDGGVDCEVTSGRPLGTAVSYTPSSMEYSRFYSVRLFDTTRAQFTTSQGATAYDAAALTDSSLVNASSTVASSTGSGWYLAHANSTDERTASSAFLNDGCVVWSTLQPNPVQTLACNATLPLDTAYTYQADATGGGIQCGSSGGNTSAATARFTTRSTYVAPQQPALVLSINATTGQVAYGGVLIEPGSGPLSSTTGVTEMVGTVHWLDVPPAVHDCRHEGNCSN